MEKCGVYVINSLPQHEHLLTDYNEKEQREYC